MLIATDGACKRNGEPTCVSVGVAWILQEDGEVLFKAMFEHESTSQRGELNGLLEALEYANEHMAEDESLSIITDSEYMFNTIEKDWVHKWARQNWTGLSGPVKNQDMWQRALKLLDSPKLSGNVFMQWTKGHLISYTPANTKRAMTADSTGIELYDRLFSVARRPADMPRIIRDFNYNRVQHGFTAVPEYVALDWAVANTMADCLASYLVSVFDDLLV